MNVKSLDNTTPKGQFERNFDQLFPISVQKIDENDKELRYACNTRKL